MSTSTIRPALHQPTGPAHTRIYAYGAARGEKIVPNDDLVGPIDSSDEWIRQRTGIVTRTRANAETTAIELSTDAAAEAIARSGVDPADIDEALEALRDAETQGRGAMDDVRHAIDLLRSDVTGVVRPASAKNPNVLTVR